MEVIYKLRYRIAYGIIFMAGEYDIYSRNQVERENAMNNNTPRMRNLSNLEVACELSSLIWEYRCSLLMLGGLGMSFVLTIAYAISYLVDNHHYHKYEESDWNAMDCSDDSLYPDAHSVYDSCIDKGDKFCSTFTLECQDPCEDICDIANKTNNSFSRMGIFGVMLNVTLCLSGPWFCGLGEDFKRKYKEILQRANVSERRPILAREEEKTDSCFDKMLEFSKQYLPSTNDLARFHWQVKKKLAPIATLILFGSAVSAIVTPILWGNDGYIDFYNGWDDSDCVKIYNMVDIDMDIRAATLENYCFGYSADDDFSCQSYDSDDLYEPSKTENCASDCETFCGLANLDALYEYITIISCIVLIVNLPIRFLWLRNEAWCDFSVLLPSCETLRSVFASREGGLITSINATQTHIDQEEPVETYSEKLSRCWNSLFAPKGYVQVPQDETESLDAEHAGGSRRMGIQAQGWADM